MLRAIHLKTAGLTSEWATAFAEMTVSRIRESRRLSPCSRSASSR